MENKGKLDVVECSKSMEELFVFLKHKNLSPQQIIVVCRSAAHMMEEVVSTEAMMVSMANMLNE